MVAVSPSTGAPSAANAPTTQRDLASADEVLMYVGAYTRDEGWVNGKAKGINTFALNTRTGGLTHLSETDVGINPTFVRGTAVRAGRKQFLYAVSEVAEPSKDKAGSTTGYVIAVEVTGRGKLSVVNRQETRGPGPTHVSVSPNEDFVAVSTYSGGAVVLYPISRETGSLSPTSDVHQFTKGSNAKPQQTAAHLHSTTWVPGTQLAFAADLGNDQIVQFKLNSSAKKLEKTSLPVVKRPAGSGPRHMAVNPAGRVAYVVDELSNTIGVFPLSAKDKSLPPRATQTISTLPTGFNSSSSAADIHVSPDGKFVYASNRGHDSIAIFRVTSQTTGTLRWVGSESTRGKIPRSFLLVEDLLVVANQNSDSIEVFRRNADGTLTYTGSSAKTNTPVSLFIPSK
ncbi:hypothetical protein PybrP1_000857 [[Pythium] brassicae (nom. inval.)]|nr:hypothetical protein PybrP1_000857 [[Pythium] brassicae (nom. inval.)]